MAGGSRACVHWGDTLSVNLVGLLVGQARRGHVWHSTGACSKSARYGRVTARGGGPLLRETRLSAQCIRIHVHAGDMRVWVLRRVTATRGTAELPRANGWVDAPKQSPLLRHAMHTVAIEEGTPLPRRGPHMPPGGRRHGVAPGLGARVGNQFRPLPQETSGILVVVRGAATSLCGF